MYADVHEEFSNMNVTLLEY